MKNYYFYTLFFLTLFVSCSENQEEISEHLIVETEFAEVVQIGKTSYLLEDSKMLKVINDESKYYLNYQNSENFLGKLVNKTGHNEYLIENPDNDEFIILQNIVQEDKNIISFEFKTSNSDLINSAIYKGGNELISNDNKCPLCVGVALAVLEAAIDFASDDYDSNCKAAIDSCGEDGPSEVNLVEGDGWFSGGSCTVKC